jgi:hypothetical protein
LKWAGIALAAAVIVLAIVATVIARRAAPTLKNRIVETLRASFHGRVELDNLDVVSWHGFEVTGGNLRIYPPETSPQTGTPPLIALKHFDFHASLPGLFTKPTHVSVVKIDGLEINIPAIRAGTPVSGEQNEKKSHDKIEILVDEIVCDNSELTIGNQDPEKTPKKFIIQHVELHNVGPTAPWRYQATLINAIPRGNIHAQGDFGPWQIDNSGDTPVTGHYRFQNADLGTINGIGGTLSSTGDFEGKLDQITIDGVTDTPNFTLETANYPLTLHTRFHAIVDGINGDTYLQPVRATLGHSNFTASGAVTDIKGKGHTIDLDVDVPAGQLQDFLALAVQTEPPVLTALIATKAKLHIGTGKQHVMQRLSIKGNFTLRSIHFTNPQVQDKVDMLSLRAQGKPQEAKPGATDVYTRMNGSFSLKQGAIAFNPLTYTLPGAKVNLQGVYTLDGQVFDFRGHVLTDLPLHKMVASRWASVALRVAGPFFRRRGGGADIPVKISGTRSAPKFGLDLFDHEVVR